MQLEISELNDYLEILRENNVRTTYFAKSRESVAEAIFYSALLSSRHQDGIVFHKSLIGIESIDDWLQDKENSTARLHAKYQTFLDQLQERGFQIKFGQWHH